MDSCSFPKDILKSISNESFKIDSENMQTTQSANFLKNILTKKVKRSKVNNKSRRK